MMSKPVTTTILAFFLVGLPVRGGGAHDCQVDAPWISNPLVCPKYQTCWDAKMFCDSKAGLDGLTNFTCHSGSVLGVYECATNSFPLTNCLGEVALNSCEQLRVVLGDATHYSVLAGFSVDNIGLSKLTGDLGVSPGTSVTGFGPGIGEMLQGSSIDVANIASAAGIFDLTAAYINAAGRVLCPISKIGDLGGMTLPPGLYKSTSGMEVKGSDLFLDAQHDGDAVWIFQMASTFSSAVGKKIILQNGAKASNIFWQVGSSATIAATSTIEGTMMADQSISLGTGAVVHGRVLARIAAVTLDACVVTIPSALNR